MRYREADDYRREPYRRRGPWRAARRTYGYAPDMRAVPGPGYGYGYGYGYGRSRRRRRRRGYARGRRGYGVLGPGARLPRRPARGFPARAVHSYDLDYGRQAGGPETDYSGRAGYPVPEPGWEPPVRGRYSPWLEERGIGDVEWFEDFGPARERPGAYGERGEFEARARSGDRPRTPFRQRSARRSPRHWSTEEAPGRGRR